MCIKGLGLCEVFVVVSFVRSMTVTVVQVVDMVVVLDRAVAAVGTVLVFVLLGFEVPLAREPTAQGAV